MNNILYVALGGIVGALLRYSLSGIIYKHSPFLSFPLGTLGVNLLGSFFIGFLYIIFEQVVLPVGYRPFFLIGLLGSFTTFSTYAFETMALIEDGEYLIATYNVLLTNLLGLLFVFAGIVTGRGLFRFFK